MEKKTESGSAKDSKQWKVVVELPKRSIIPVAIIAKTLVKSRDFVARVATTGVGVVAQEVSSCMHCSSYEMCAH